ncbi:MAG: hypothetical protein V1926_04205 [Candidatus Peregrinibacteria bacterium]
MQRICRNVWCLQPFDITTEDLAFYEKVSPVFSGKKELIPPPKLCPECRDQRRYTFRNERSLHHGTCTSCSKKIITMYAPESPFNVYCTPCYFSDRWDAASYGQALSFSEPLLTQFQRLRQRIPVLSCDQYQCENSDYSNISIGNKNCYLVFATREAEECYYARKLVKTLQCVDCDYADESQYCYECTDCHRCYRVLFSEQCYNCSSSAFLFDCIGAKNCFLCSNIRNRQYCFRNQQLTETDYRQQMSDLGSRLTIGRLQQEFATVKTASIHRQSFNVCAEDCIGNHLTNCKRCLDCFDLYGCEECIYTVDTMSGVHHLMDCSSTTKDSEFSYDCVSCSTSIHSGFCVECRDGNVDCFYCDATYSSQNLFGCAGLKHKQYCILNKQYTEEEYERLVPKIIEKMRMDGEWGEFFPVELSPFAYNETVAQEYFPLTKEEVMERGWKWRDQTDEMPKVDRIIPASQLPDSIDDIPDDILNWAIECEATRRPFKIIKQELDFYRKMRLPVPHFHPDERHRRRMALRNPRKLWNRECAKCHKPIATSYSPERPKIVYCEECYLKEVY